MQCVAPFVATIDAIVSIVRHSQLENRCVVHSRDGRKIASHHAIARLCVQTRFQTLLFVESLCRMHEDRMQLLDAQR